MRILSHSVTGFDVIVLGDCGVDIYVRVNQLPSHDDKVPGDYIGSYGGGVGANYACAAARLGMRTGFLSIVGADAYGELAVTSVREFGVNTSGVQIRAGEVTHFCLVALDDTGEKALIIVRTNVFFPRWEDIDLDLIEHSRMLHIAPFNMQVAAQAAAYAAAHGVSVSVDLEPSMFNGGLEAAGPLLGNARLLFPNEQCMDALFGSGNYAFGAKKLLSMGPEVVVMTRGARGALIWTRKEAIAVPAFHVLVKDTTGAGDCFNATFASAWLRGLPIVDAGRLAAAAAAISVTAIGARGHLPSLAQVQEFLTLDPPVLEVQPELAQQRVREWRTEK